MAKYHFLDESGDPGLDIDSGASSHFAIAMVQLPNHLPVLSELASLRSKLRFPENFEFKHHKAKSWQKQLFFETIKNLDFRIRAVVLNKLQPEPWMINLKRNDFYAEVISRLVIRENGQEIVNDTLMIDGAIPDVKRAIRVRLSQFYQVSDRERPFKKIVGGKSHHEDGLQLADMIAGAIRMYSIHEEHEFVQSFASKIVDLWRIPTQ